MSTKKSLSAFCSTASTGSSLLDSFRIYPKDKSAVTLLSNRPVVDADIHAEPKNVLKEPAAANRVSQKQISAREANKVKSAKQIAVERISKVLQADKTELNDQRCRS